MDPKVKELFEKAKLTATAAVEAAGKAAGVAGKKAGEVVENTKLNLKAFDLNAEIELLYKEIGKMVYQTHTGIDVDTGELDSQLQAIDEKNAEINEIKEKINSVKTTVKCVNCGKAAEKNDSFCRHCGAQL